MSLKKKIEYYSTGKKKVLFLGDSITEQTTWDDLFPNTVTLNNANGGNTTELISNSLNTDFADKADKIFIMAGLNDLGAGKTPEETIKSYEVLLKKINKDRVIIESVLPINDSMKDFNYPNYKATSKNILKLDSLIKKLCSTHHITYVDIYSNMKNSKNQLNPNYTFDGVHLNRNGYAILKSFLKSTVSIN